jgi:3-isopropylmalate/(R)-2-methylmalate dehydratase small subunit
MAMRFTGNAFVFGDNVNTDEIIAARYLNTSDPKELAKYLMEDVRPGFSANLPKGAIMVSGDNFGCGSSREHAPIAIKAAGIPCVVAVGFARIFFRNAINIGLPIVECPDIAGAVAEGDRIDVDLTAGVIVLPSGRKLAITPFPPFMEAIVKEGGWLPYLLATYGREAR